MIQLRHDISDDQEFTKLIEGLVHRLTATIEPVELYLIKIDHWFDFKWRDFQGKLLGALGSWNTQILKIPPFIPDRVIEERFYELIDGSLQPGVEPALHIYQTSSSNITGKRRLVASFGPRLFIWYSGETLTTLRGSVMVYQVDRESHSTFYISLMKKSGWKILKTDGISRTEAIALLEPAFTES